ncbi:MAG: nucleotidyltransferase domain-containing protein [Candidatus Acidiferrales bacterium]
MSASHFDVACAEKRLLVACARTRINSSAAAQIAELLSQPLDWEYVLAEAAENSIVPLLERQLRAVAPGSVPPVPMEWLKNATRANVVRCLFLASELTKILARFESEGIQAVPYKGPVLALQAYGDVILRDFDDLDIILRQSDMPRANEIMLALGYQARFPWILGSAGSLSMIPGEYNYRDDARRIMVELHTERTFRHFPRFADIDDFATRLERVEFAGQRIASFSPEDTLILLCIHGAKDFWERLSWIADVSELIQAHSLAWEEVFARSEAIGATRMLSVGLSLASALLGAPLPAMARDRVRPDRVAALVVSQISQRALNRHSPPLSAVGRFRFRSRMMRGRVIGFRYAMRLALVPAEEDWEMIRLPASLSPLYLALRPLRLLRKYGWINRTQ